LAEVRELAASASRNHTEVVACSAEEGLGCGLAVVQCALYGYGRSFTSGGSDQSRKRNLQVSGLMQGGLREILRR